MRRRRFPIALLGLALGMSGCAPRLAIHEPDPIAVEGLMAALAQDAAEQIAAQQARVNHVGARLRVGGAAMCADQRAPLLGFRLAQRGHRRPAPVWAGYLALFGVGHEPTVTAIDPRSPAAEAGVRPGDRILRVNGRRTRRSREVFATVRRQPDAEPVLRIRRDGEDLELAVSRRLACWHETVIRLGDLPTTFSDPGGQVSITTGLVEFTRSDDELAVALAHEIAHQVLGGEGPDEELAADRLGLAIAAASDYDVTVAPELWRRIALEQPWLVVHHPSPPGERLQEPRHARIAERLLAMPLVIEQIGTPSR